MKVLDPQSAVLTNSEVLSFMRTHPPRKPDPRVGAYATTDMKGLWGVQKEFTNYAQEITPYLLEYPDPPSKYLLTLLRRLRKFELAKPEVVMMVNLGLGVQKASDPRQQGVVEAHDEPAAETGTEILEGGAGDLLDQVERHINSAGGVIGGHGNSNGSAREEHNLMEIDQQAHPDSAVLETVIEDMFERFSVEEINEILRICGEVLARPEKDSDEMAVEDG